MKYNRRTFLGAITAAPFATAQTAVDRHVIWRPTSSPGQVMLHGPAGQDQRPKPPLQFIEEELGGTNPKVLVHDAAGRKWLVKWAEEVHAETFASRFAAAAGYFVRTAYFVPEGRIDGCRDLKRASGSIEDDGSFQSAVFKLFAEDEPYVEDRNWAWEQNPFLDSPDGLRELNGLKIMLMLTSNWDAKDGRDVNAGPNTAIYEVKQAGSVEYRYAFDDWGGSMGRWGGVFGRSKWDPLGYQEQTPDFVKGVNDEGVVKWGYRGKNGDEVTDEIRPTDAHWLVDNLRTVADEDLLAALRDAGAEDIEAAIFVQSLRDRLAQLEKLSA